MPRTGDNYDYPAGTLGISGQTIFSARYNAWVEDIKSTLNLPLPISKGGTGADNVTQARAYLQVERAMQVVTDFDNHAWEPGSFVAAPGALGSPVPSSYFLGNYVGDTGSSVILAYDISNTTLPHPQYLRQRVSSVWGSWFFVGSDSVDVAGDTMTGNLTINKDNATLTITGTGTPAYIMNAVQGQQPVIVGRKGGVDRWLVIHGDSSAESGGSTGFTGSDFAIWRCRNDGTLTDAPFNITRATGNVNLSASLNAGGSIVASGSISTAVKNNLMGIPGGTAFTGAVVPTDANIKLYDYGSGNWCGIGVDLNGAFWLRTGTSGAPIPAFAVTANGVASHTNGVNFKDTVTTNMSGAPCALSIDYIGASGASWGIVSRNRTPGNFASVQLFQNSAGTSVGNIIHNDVNTTSFNTSSDAALKEDLQPLVSGPVIDKIKVYDFAWKSGGRGKGVVGQEVIDAFADAVTPPPPDSDIPWMVDYSKFVPLLLQEVKELRARVAVLEGTVTPKETGA